MFPPPRWSAAATIESSALKRDEHRAAQIARKEALAAEAEDLAANATQWKSAGDRMRAILDEWKTVSGLDRKTDDALWKRYSAARETFNRRRGSHFADLDRERAGARAAKERLCERAEELTGSTDWAATSAAFRALLAEWKTVGRAAKDVDDKLWHRFKAAQDAFFSARNAVSAERAATGQVLVLQRADPLGRGAVLWSEQAYRVAQMVVPCGVALAWLVNKPEIHSPVIGVSRIEQLDQLVGATDITLAPEDVAYLEELYQPLENLLSIGSS